MTIRFVSLALAATVSLIPFVAMASQPFNDTAFADAQAKGKSVLVDVSAPWCPTCAKQKSTIQSLEIDHPSLVVLDVDFDREKDVLKHFQVQSQSTLIMFKGSVETGRSTGQTNPEVIRNLIEKGL